MPEQLDSLRKAVFIDLKILLMKPGHIMPSPVMNGNGKHHQVHVYGDAEGCRRRLNLRCGAQERRERRYDCRSARATRAASPVCKRMDWDLRHRLPVILALPLPLHPELGPAGTALAELREPAHSPAPRLR